MQWPSQETTAWERRLKQFNLPGRPRCSQIGYSMRGGPRVSNCISRRTARAPTQTQHDNAGGNSLPMPNQQRGAGERVEAEVPRSGGLSRRKVERGGRSTVSQDWALGERQRVLASEKNARRCRRSAGIFLTQLRQQLRRTSPFFPFLKSLVLLFRRGGALASDSGTGGHWGFGRKRRSLCAA